MIDSQLPRYEVLLQATGASKFVDAGSVHAADPEMALLNARDVFARRPECIAMWVVPVAAIYSRTAQELALQPLTSPADLPSEDTYYIFAKTKSIAAMSQLGSCTSISCEAAFAGAIREYSAGKNYLAWWVIPARQVYRSQEKDYPSLYAPAFDKVFRMATDFHTHTAMRQLRDSPSSIREDR
jgi:ring-1,2-phenylacetyl-CoA epoxidase subunit PaaB